MINISSITTPCELNDDRVRPMRLIPIVAQITKFFPNVSNQVTIGNVYKKINFIQESLKYFHNTSQTNYVQNRWFRWSKIYQGHSLGHPGLIRLDPSDFLRGIKNPCTPSFLKRRLCLWLICKKPSSSKIIYFRSFILTQRTRTCNQKSLFGFYLWSYTN